MHVKLATINLQVADPERSRQFYREVLGMAEDPRRSHPPTFVYMSSEGCDLTITTPLEAAGALPSPTMELGFEVDDFEAMRAHLAAVGIPDYHEQSMGWGEAFELKDPDGHRVVVYSFRRPGRS